MSAATIGVIAPGEETASGAGPADFARQLDLLPRRFPAGLPVAQVGYLRHKRYRVRQTFQTANISLILRGQGSYRLSDRLVQVAGPCVLTQWPGQLCDYGPDEDWEECFLIYDARCCARLEAMGLYRPDRPVWWPADATRLRRQVGRIAALLDRADPAAAVDLVDRLCEQLVLVSLLDATPSHGPEAAVARLRARLAAAPQQRLDLDAVAAAEGLSSTHLRRCWRRLVGMPPERYRSELCMRLACRLLRGERRPIAAIAAELGFADPLHFSRRFRQLVGCSPSAYRDSKRPDMDRIRVD